MRGAAHSASRPRSPHPLLSARASRLRAAERAALPCFDPRSARQVYGEIVKLLEMPQGKLLGLLSLGGSRGETDLVWRCAEAVGPGLADGACCCGYRIEFAAVVQWMCAPTASASLQHAFWALGSRSGILSMAGRFFRGCSRLLCA